MTVKQLQANLLAQFESYMEDAKLAVELDIRLSQGNKVDDYITIKTDISDVQKHYESLSESEFKQALDLSVAGLAKGFTEDADAKLPSILAATQNKAP